MNERVVVTGLGVLAANGNNVHDFELALRKGQSGIRLNEDMIESGFACHVAGVPQGIDELAEASFTLGSSTSTRSAWPTRTWCGRRAARMRRRPRNSLVTTRLT